jgi:class 3 adenylate cyclase/tetratricopeptide (TPR) repeat protein
MQELTAYLPMDRCQAMARSETLPDRCTGAALFADISGFTPLAETLVTELGRKRGAEELLHQINPIYEALIAELHRYGGSVVGFVGDAITCWLDEAPSPLARCRDPNSVQPSAARAVACGLAMQEIMKRFATARTPTGTAINLGIKVAIAAGPARRFVVGDPAMRLLDVLAGDTLTRMAAAEQVATHGEVVLSEEVATALAGSLQIAEWRRGGTDEARFAQITHLSMPVPQMPWPPLDLTRLAEGQLQPWLLPAVYRRLQAGERFLGSFRLVVPLFLRFGGIDYDVDDDAGVKLDAYIRWVQGILERYEGNLIQLTIGDKGSVLYAAFGVLLTHEDDPTRALMAALALQQPPLALSYIGPVQIGVSQGPVWAGACGSFTRRDYASMGYPVIMAARLMARAKPGQVLVSQAAADQAQGRPPVPQGRFRFRDLGAIRVKGSARPLLVVEAVRVEMAGQHLLERFERPMVGRDEELKQLLLLLDEVEAGTSRVVTIEAEAGVGKSRLVTAWAGHAHERGLSVLWGTAQSIERHAPYRAWRDVLSAFLGLEESTAVTDRRARAENCVHALAPDAAVYIPLLNDILDLNLLDNELTGGLSAQGRQQALITLLLGLFQAAAARSPLLLVLEDVHWLDALSWELALQLARSLEATGAPFLLLLVTRPVVDLPATAAALRRLPYSRLLPLSALRPAAIEALIANHLGVAIQRLPPELIELIQSRAEGNPFFAEELLLNLEAQGVVTVRPDPGSGQARCHLHKELAQVAEKLPDSLQGVILARVDRLPPMEQLLLKLAAVIGRSFGYPPLHHLYRNYRGVQAVAPVTELAHLEENGFLLTETPEAEPTYQFKHIVIHQVAYETLLYEQRRPLHRAAAAWYEQAHSGEVADSPYLPLLVYHYRGAEEAAPERRYAYLAGRQAAARYANDDALTYFDRALQLTPTTERAAQYQAVWAREEIYDRLGQREAQAADLDQLAALAATAAQRIAVALRQGAYHNNVGDYEAAAAISEQAYLWAAESGDSAAQAQAMINSGLALMQRGDYEMATRRYRRAYELAQAAAAATQAARAWSGLGEVAFRQGDYRNADHHHQQSLRLRQEINDRPGQVQSLRQLGQIANAQGEYESARQHYLQALQLARQMGDRPGEGRLLLRLGGSDWRQGAYPRAAAYLQQGLTLAQSSGDRRTEADSLNSLGIVADLQAQYDQAIGY